MYLCMYVCIIRSNLRVAESGRFVVNLVYSGGGTMLPKILDFKLFEILKNALSRIFCSPELYL